MTKRRTVLLGLIVILMLLSACASGGTTTSAKMAPMSSMPTSVQQSPARVRQAYQFAVANPELMQHFPCYCGCGAMGHTSNLACYVKEFKDGAPVFDSHALGCSICVDITQDVMRLSGQGKSWQEIRPTIVGTYSKFGPANQ